VPLRWLSEAEFRQGEPELKAAAVLESPDTGIIDAHALISHLEWQFEQNNGIIALNSPVESIEHDSGGYTLSVGGANADIVKTDVIVNAAGLWADKVTNKVVLL